MVTERPNVDARIAIMIVWLCAAALAVAQTDPDDSDSEDKPPEDTTKTRSGAEATSSAATDTGQEPGTGCEEADEDWSPKGRWSGRYQVVGENLNVDYTVSGVGEIEMQLYLTPLSDNAYHITNVRWQELTLEFSKDSDTHCLLSRDTANEAFEGHCEDSEGRTTVSFISMRALPTETSECQE